MLARVWADSVTLNPAIGLLALRVESTAQDIVGLSGLARYVATMLENELDGRSALPGLADKLRVTAVAAVFDAVSRAHLARNASGADFQRVSLADLALRLLR